MSFEHGDQFEGTRFNNGELSEDVPPLMGVSEGPQITSQERPDDEPFTSEMTGYPEAAAAGSNPQAESGPEPGVAAQDTEEGYLESTKGVIEHTATSNPDALIRRMAKGIHRKATTLQRLFRQPDTLVEADVGRIERAMVLAENLDTFHQPRSRERESLQRYLTSPRQPDRFTIQDRGKELADALFRDVPAPDMVDITVAVPLVMKCINGMLVDADDASALRFNDRYGDLQDALVEELAARIPTEDLGGGGIIPLQDIFRLSFGREPIDVERQFLDRMQHSVDARMEIISLVMSEGLWNVPGGRGPSQYAKRPAPGELERMNEAAADTLEQLQLLKAFGVTAIEIPAATLRLPWDVAIEPPLEIKNGSTGYAEGGVVDFLFLKPNPNRTDLKLHVEHTETGDTHISVGDTSDDVVMRFRLHNNGQFSHGHRYHNVPSDATERAFETGGGSLAFKRIRGVIIAAAADAVLRQTVINSRTVSGSTAKMFAERPHAPLGRIITDLLLRRAQVMREAGVRPDRPIPPEWEGPTQGIAGYVRRLAPGTRRGPNAEAIAREYFESLNIDFDGLPEGYTFTRPYDRRTTKTGEYRRARFREDSSTSVFLKEFLQ